MITSSFSITKQQHDYLKAKAHERGMSVSEILRQHLDLAINLDHKIYTIIRNQNYIIRQIGTLKDE